LLSSLDLLQDLLPAITHHHERWDGGGYPEGLSGLSIPLWGRIIAIADAYDTMVSRRTYKAPMSYEQIVGEIQGGRGSQFDPELADIMLEVLAERRAANAT
jgi:polar amino acid transport system substrate-binding protein